MQPALWVGQLGLSRKASIIRV